MTSDLPLQPRTGQLTLAACVREAGRTWVFALCFCGRFLRMRLAAWLDGGQRPQSCVHCLRKNKRPQVGGRRAPARAF